MVITSLKGKRSQGVGGPAWGPVGPASTLNIQQVFTFANCLRQPTMKSVRISFRRQLDGALRCFPFSLSSFHLFFSFFLLVLSPRPSHRTLRFCSHLPPTWSGERHAQRGEGCPLLSYPSFPRSGAQLHLGINQACVGNEHGEILIFVRAAASTRLAVANLVSVFI